MLFFLQLWLSEMLQFMGMSQVINYAVSARISSLSTLGHYSEASEEPSRQTSSLFCHTSHTICITGKVKSMTSTLAQGERHYLRQDTYFSPQKCQIPQVPRSSHYCSMKITGNRRWDRECSTFTCRGSCCKNENKTPQQCTVEVNQDPSKLWYELSVLQLMQLPEMWLSECHTKESSEPSFSTP